MAWALGLAWVLFAAEFGYCPPIKWGLSLYIWNLIGKLSYAIYLVHINVYTLYYFQTRQGAGIKGDDSDDQISHEHLKFLTNINFLRHRYDPIKAIYFTHLILFFIYLATFSITTIIALVLHLTFEIPLKLFTDLLARKINSPKARD